MLVVPFACSTVAATTMIDQVAISDSAMPMRLSMRRVAMKDSVTRGRPSGAIMCSACSSSTSSDASQKNM